MTDLVANLAVIGRIQIIPGILPVSFQEPNIECLVAHSFHNKILDPEHGIEIDTSDCTFFTVTHIGQGEVDVGSEEIVKEIFERSVVAISEVVIWSKAHDRIGIMSTYSRQIGTLDVKAFFVMSDDKRLVGWLNPAFTLNRDAAAMMAGFMPNMIMTNGPSANPIPPVARRVMSSLDLINLGFYTESFVNLFSLVDDLTQEVIKAGLVRKGLNDDEQKGLLRAIKEERLKIYLCNLAKLCGWQSLEDSKKDLYDRVVKVNALRNKIMHGARRLSRSQSIEASNVLLLLIGWLRNNPFDFKIANFPLLQIAQPQFSLIPLKEAAILNEAPKSDKEV